MKEPDAESAQRARPRRLAAAGGEREFEFGVEEYRALRREIELSQNARFVTLGACLGLVGAVVSAIAGTDASTSEQSLRVAALGSFGMMVIAVALLLTTHYSRGINFAASYLRRYVEPRLPGIYWERTLQLYRERTKGTPSFAFGSRPLSILYAVLAAALAFLTIASGAASYPVGLIAVLLLAGVCVIFAVCLHAQLPRRAFRIAWELVESESPSGDRTTESHST